MSLLPETHWANKCPIPTKPKTELMQKEKRCYRCLNSRHAIDACTKQWACWKGGSSDHHAALCQSRRPNESPRRPPVASTSTVAPTPGDVFIKTATVTIQGPIIENRAICLMDDGSQRSYIRRKWVVRVKHIVDDQHDEEGQEKGRDAIADELFKGRYIFSE